MKLLLHTCCAPCSGAILETLLKEGVKPVIYYCNPNIYPREEYEKRKYECTKYADSLGLEVIDADYCHDEWLRCVQGLENEPERGMRCTECFRYRLLSSARYALEHGFDTLATTLASSRWKDLNQVNEAGKWAIETALKEIAAGTATETAAAVEAAAKAKAGTAAEAEAAAATEGSVAELVWWDRNWRKGGLQERRSQIIKEQNFYNQLYCGCEFSIRK